MTNRKSHTRFQLVPKSATLDDLEGPLRTLFGNTRLLEPTTKIWMKTDPYYQWRRCSPLNGANSCSSSSTVLSNQRHINWSASFSNKDTLSTYCDWNSRLQRTVTFSVLENVCPTSLLLQKWQNTRNVTQYSLQYTCYELVSARHVVCMDERSAAAFDVDTHFV